MLSVRRDKSSYSQTRSSAEKDAYVAPPLSSLASPLPPLHQRPNQPFFVCSLDPSAFGAAACNVGASRCRSGSEGSTYTSRKKTNGMPRRDKRGSTVCNGTGYTVQFSEDRFRITIVASQNTTATCAGVRLCASQRLPNAKKQTKKDRALFTQQVEKKRAGVTSEGTNQTTRGRGRETRYTTDSI